VALLRKQEGDSNRRTKTTKIRITDLCFISLGYRGASHDCQLASRSYRRLDGCRVGGINGSAYFIGGFGMTALTANNIVVVPTHELVAHSDP